MKLNDTDKEILSILKVVLGPPDKAYDSDDVLKGLILKVLLVFSILGLSIVIYGDITNSNLPGALPGAVALHLALFFNVLTLYINAKSKNSSLLVLGFTWLPMHLGYYLGSI